MTSSDDAITKEQMQTPAENGQEPADYPFSNQFIQDSFQSLTRISLAGLGGSLAGAGMEKRQQQLGQSAMQQQPYPSAGSTNSHHPHWQFRKAPPAPVGKTSSIALRVNLPATWALSCSFFVLVLETARRTSPTTVILERMTDMTSERRLGKYQHAALVATGDYAIGGMGAGLAATVARRTPLRWGLGMGFTLGLIAGVAQGGFNVAELYLLDHNQN